MSNKRRLNELEAAAGDEDDSQLDVLVKATQREHIDSIAKEREARNKRRKLISLVPDSNDKSNKELSQLTPTQVAAEFNAEEGDDSIDDNDSIDDLKERLKDLKQQNILLQRAEMVGHSVLDFEKSKTKEYKLQCNKLKLDIKNLEDDIAAKDKLQQDLLDLEKVYIKKIDTLEKENKEKKERNRFLKKRFEKVARKNTELENQLDIAKEKLTSNKSPHQQQLREAVDQVKHLKNRADDLSAIVRDERKVNIKTCNKLRDELLKQDEMMIKLRATNYMLLTENNRLVNVMHHPEQPGECASLKVKYAMLGKLQKKVKELLGEMALDTVVPDSLRCTNFNVQLKQSLIDFMDEWKKLESSSNDSTTNSNNK